MIHKNSIIFSVLIVVLLLISGCATTKQKIIVTRGEAFPYVYSEQPRSIVVLPPMNLSALPEAGDYYMATIATPLISAGYDVLPAESVAGIIKQKGLDDTELLYTVPVQTLHEYFAADAVFYTHIRQWEVVHTGLISRLIISIEAEIISSKTSQQLWSYSRSLNVDLNTVRTTGGAVLLLGSTKTDVDKATADSIAYALKVNTKLIRNLPYGPEHEDYLQDQDVALIGTVPEKFTSQP